MNEPFRGSEAIARRRLTRHALRSQFVALYPDVYVPANAELTAALRARAAWLWSQRRGFIAGQSASALHGARWVDSGAPAELLYGCRRPPKGIRTWSDRVAEDEIQLVAGVSVTTPARTALDLACRYPVGKAVAAIDSLVRATRVKVVEVKLLAERYRGRRGIKRAHTALGLVDPGAESPKESWLRLLLIRAGFPPPQTQIPVYDEYGRLVAVLDMGWEHVQLAVEYDGDHHRTDRRQFNKDIRRAETLTGLRWTNVRVTSADTEWGIIRRVSAAWQRRTCTQGGISTKSPPSLHVG